MSSNGKHSNYQIFKLLDPECDAVMLVGVAQGDKESIINHFMVYGSIHPQVNSWLLELKQKNLKPYVNLVEVTVSKNQIHETARGLAKLFKCEYYEIRPVTRPTIEA